MDGERSKSAAAAGPPAARREVRRPAVGQLEPDVRTAVERCARALRERGVRAWLVGGAPRDLALGLAPKDADLASAATPERIAAWFPDSLGVGAAFGTMVLPPSVTRGPAIELTTFRSEREYSDGRHPDAVAYSSEPEVDARRRDFTCNALYLDPLTDELLDPTGGLADLEAGRLRAIGSAAERFREDALRVLRLARFAARFDLALDPATAAAARDEAAGLVRISAERTAQELERMLTGPDPERAVRLLGELNALQHAWPQVAPDGTNAGDLAPLVAAALQDPRADPARPSAATAELGFAALLLPLHRAAGRDGSAAALEALKPSSRRRSGVLALLEAFDAIAGQGAEAPARARLLRRLRETDDARAFALAAASATCAGVPDAAALELAQSTAAAVAPDERQPAPLLSAGDLIDAGVERGPRLGELLRALEDAQLDGRLGTRAEAAAWLAELLAR